VFGSTKLFANDTPIPVLDPGPSILIPIIISIGAPARGATRLKQIASTPKSDVFRPALPHRERPDRQLLPFQSVCFDPRSRTGGDGSAREYF
jgi:hypothetical protein